MSTFKVLAGVVCLAFGLQAMDFGHDAEWDSNLRSGRVAMQKHDFAEAARLFNECVSLSSTSGERLTALAVYGIALNEAGRYQEARIPLEQVLAAPAVLLTEEARVTISTVLASVDRSLGDYRSAERVLRTAIGADSEIPATRATLVLSLADLLREEARDSEGLALVGKANQLTGLSSAVRTGLKIEAAELTRQMGMWSESIEDWNQIGALAESEHSLLLEAVFTGGLGETWFDAGDTARAEPLLRRSVKLVRDDPDASPSQVATALAALARLYITEDKLALAEETLDEAIAKDEASFGPGHPQVGLLLELRAQSLSRHGEAEAAREDLERARSIMSDSFGPESVAVASVLAAVGDVEVHVNRPKLAIAQYQAAMRMTRDAGQDGAKLGNDIALRYATLLKAAHKPEEARAVLAQGTTQSFVGK